MFSFVIFHHYNLYFFFIYQESIDCCEFGRKKKLLATVCFDLLYVEKVPMNYGFRYKKYSIRESFFVVVVACTLDKKKSLLNSHTSHLDGSGHFFFRKMFRFHLLEKFKLMFTVNSLRAFIIIVHLLFGPDFWCFFLSVECVLHEKFVAFMKQKPF